jgi:hypothetical protein
MVAYALLDFVNSASHLMYRSYVLEFVSTVSSDVTSSLAYICEVVITVAHWKLFSPPLCLFVSYDLTDTGCGLSCALFYVYCATKRKVVKNWGSRKCITKDSSGYERWTNTLWEKLNQGYVKLLQQTPQKHVAARERLLLLLTIFVGVSFEKMFVRSTRVRRFLDKLLARSLEFKGRTTLRSLFGVSC